jgi:hypothetical protein
MENQTVLEKKDSYENIIHICRPSERHLEKEKRNKRKSKIYSIKNDNKSLQVSQEEVVNPIKIRDIFHDFEVNFNKGSPKFYTLENFERVEDENFHPNNDLKKIVKEMEENMMATPSNFTISNCKASFSQRFKESADHKDPFYSHKRFKI